ncbi:uncharacterized protein SPSC_03110 [Sporisorium scitamineum]|uniref:Yeast cell wall synthesis Kre9/Knh1-like N-terminal domain-containing protein n=1 Tax=Sporisorium scitamineum TaxID=49012 RepID=A0A0F7S0Z1_9BASI|nr:hypothetical protein [Sporisorium scitamineum]CDS82291.1 uncharacterized protein SPSC_03110 [Sporisorium scitamineum]
MVSAKITTFAVLALAAVDAAVSTIVVTKPVASTTGHGGKRLDIEWSDDGKAPTHRDWGRINIYLATGSRDVQFKLQTLDRNVSYNQGGGSYKIDPTSGPSGGYYFIRFEGTNTTTNAVPAMAFSARFSLDQMTGTFNSTIMSTLQGTSGTGQLTAAASTTSSSPSFFSYTSTQSVASAAATAAASSVNSAASSSSTSVKSTSDAAPAVNRLTGYASALVGLAAVGAAFL